MQYVNLASIRECTEAEGPGKRFALWCQGCLQRCKNCCNPEMQPLVRNKVVDCDDLIEVIKRAKETFELEGISFIGGEPFLQAQGLSYIAKWCQENGLSVLVFTGYTLDELEKGEIPFAEDLLRCTDILVDGLFIEELYDDRREWVGSTNQRVIFLTDFYRHGIEFQRNERAMEICVSEDKVLVNGWPF